MLLNKQTKTQIDAFRSNPHVPLLITGPKGSGKKYVATNLAKTLLSASAELVDNSAVMIIQSESGTLTIDDARKAKQFVTLKTIGEGTIKRAILIFDAEKLTIEAQNALLKLIEEPPEDTTIVLTLSKQAKLLPTIVSRTQNLQIKPISRAELENHFSHSDFKTHDITKAYHLSDGRIGLMSQILTGKAVDLLESVKTAKTLLASDKMTRLNTIDGFTKDKSALGLLIEAFDIIGHAALKQDVIRQNPAQIKKWYESLKAIEQANLAINHNANSKLTLTNLFLSV